MKTTMIILTTIFTLQINLLFASTDGTPVNTTTDINLCTLVSLAPITPKEATFEELAASDEFLIPAPATPKEALFEDPNEDVPIITLVPVTPGEAGFNDDPAQAMDIRSFAPVIPAVADFEEFF